MLIFSEDKYIPIESDVIQMSIPGQGFLLIGLDTYFDLARYQMPQNQISDKFNHRELYEWFIATVPEPVSYLGILIELLDFEVPQNLEVIFGCFSVILKTRSVDDIFSMSRDRFSAIKLSTYVMKEYIAPRKLFLAECLKYDDLISEVPKPTYNFLYLAPVAPGTSVPMVPFATSTDSVNNSTSPLPEEDIDDYHYYIANKDRFQYFGNGTFFNTTTGEMFELDDYNDEELCEAFGLEVADTSDPVPAEEPAETPAPVVEIPEPLPETKLDDPKEDAENRTSIADLFKNMRRR